MTVIFGVVACLVVNFIFLVISGVILHNCDKKTAKFGH